MPLTQHDDRQQYSVRGTSEGVRKLLQAAGILKQEAVTETGWDRLVADLSRRASVSPKHLTSKGPDGMLRPGVSVNGRDLKEAGGCVFLYVSEPKGEFSIEAVDEDGNEVKLVHIDADSDFQFARLLAAAVYFTPSERFTLTYGDTEDPRAVRPELVLSRHLLEMLQVGEGESLALSRDA